MSSRDVNLRKTYLARARHLKQAMHEVQKAIDIGERADSITLVDLQRVRDDIRDEIDYLQSLVNQDPQP